MAPLKAFAVALLLLAPCAALAREHSCICYRAFECRRVCHKPLAVPNVGACIEKRCAEHKPLTTCYPAVTLCLRCDDHQPLATCFPEPCVHHCDCD